MVKVVIEPELEKVWLPPTPEEYKILEEQILEHGCLDPIKIWERGDDFVLLDGHNRLKICRENDLHDPPTVAIAVDNIYEAIIWIIDNQKGRRNATAEQIAYAMGKRYDATKELNRRRDEKGKFDSSDPGGQNDHMGSAATAKAHAAKGGVGEKTVRRNAKFSEGIDIIREHNPELATAILTNQKGPKLNKGEVEEVSKLKNDLPETKLKEVIQAGPAAVKAVVKERKESRSSGRGSSGGGSASKPKPPKEPTAAVKASPVELWCEDCRWGFDVYLPAPTADSPICPYCGGPNVDRREENWSGQ